MAFKPVEGKAVAVIGGGISGVVAAQTLSAQHEVLGGTSRPLGWGFNRRRRNNIYQLNHAANTVHINGIKHPVLTVRKPQLLSY